MMWYNNIRVKAKALDRHTKGLEKNLKKFSKTP
jgi:hypothetical protein